MDEFYVEAQQESDCLTHLPFFVFVNGENLNDDGEWFSLGLDSYLRALDLKESTVKFIGGCGEFACCGWDLWTRTTPECWSWFTVEDKKWKEYRFSWSDVYKATRYMIEKNQCIPENSEPGDPCYEHLPELREKLQFIKAMVEGKQTSLSIDPEVEISIDEWKREFS